MPQTRIEVAAIAVASLAIPLPREVFASHLRFPSAENGAVVSPSARCMEGFFLSARSLELGSAAQLSPVADLP